MTKQHPRLAIVTGASRGIGAALAETLAMEGYHILAVARRFPDYGQPPAIERMCLDLTAPDSTDALVERVSALGQPLDLLVNNAGVQSAWDLLADGTSGVQAARQDLCLNLEVPIRLTSALLPHMRRPGGIIVNVTSLVALHPKPSAPVYSATKAGLRAFTHALRQQVSDSGITVTEAIPPLVETEMTAGRRGAKLSAEQMAQAISAGISARSNTVAPGLSRRVLVLNRLLPELVARVLARA